MYESLLSRLEGEACAGSWPRARPLLIHLLQSLDSDGELIATPSATVRQLCTRLAAVLMGLCADSRCPLTHEDYSPLAPHSVTIAHVFYLSGFGTPNPLLNLILDRGQRDARQGVVFTDPSDVRKFMLTCSLQSQHCKHLLSLAARDPRAFYLPLLRAYDVHLTGEPKILDRRERLLAATHLLTDVTPGTNALDSIHHLWALCSYATTPDRHQTKRHLNSMMRNWLHAQGLVPRTLPPRQPVAGRPTLLVVCEVMARHHVMYRCYAPFLSQLRQRFRVVGLIARADWGGDGMDWCDDVMVVEKGVPLKEIVECIERLQPDALYYPCLGMRLWTVLLCNIRLAPWQFATLGHPATTHSSEIDCLVVGRDIFGGSDCFSEKVVLSQAPGNLFHLRDDDAALALEVREHPDPLCVAICANLQKLNATFLATCRRIAERSPRRIHFHIFPNVVGLRYHVTCRQMEDALAGIPVTVHQRAPWAIYRQQLHRCDLYLSPFPFGGENSALDAVLHGLPLVTLLGTEPHARLDARVARLAGLPDWVITHSPEEYEETALRLITDDSLRCTLSRDLSPQRIAADIERENRQYQTDFVDTVWWAYENQTTIRHAVQRLWEPTGDGHFQAV